jgi:Protein of unknown function (DUF4238)
LPANKKHHFVPRFYLKRFSGTGTSICLYSFSAKKLVTAANLRNQCYRDYMYGKDQSLEHSLGELESAFAPLIEKITRLSALPPPLTEDHENLCIMVVLQYARTAYSADVLNQFADGMWRNILKHDSRVTPEMLSRVRIVHQEPARYVVSLFLRSYHLIMDLGYRLLRAPTGTEFIASDNPVVMYNQLLEPTGLPSATGAGAKGLQIFFPLSPTHLLFMYDRHAYAVTPRHQRLVDVPTKADMDQLNILQVANASDAVYLRSSAADIFRLLEGGSRFRHSRKASVETFRRKGAQGDRSELIGISRQDARTNFSLSFVKLLKPTKAWRTELLSRRLIPSVILRNESYYRAHRAFSKLVDQGKYQPTEFFKYLRASGTSHDA